MSLHSVSVNRRSSIAPVETIASQRFVLHFVLRHKVANAPQIICMM